MPQEVTIEDKNTVEQMQLIQQIDKEDKNAVFKIIDKMLTSKKIKDFFNKSVAALETKSPQLKGFLSLISLSFC